MHGMFVSIMWPRIHGAHHYIVIVTTPSAVNTLKFKAALLYQDSPKIRTSCRLLHQQRKSRCSVARF